MTIQSKAQPENLERRARIGYKNLLTGTTTGAAAVMLVPNTYERYKAGTSSTTIKFQLSAAAPIDFIALAAHNAGTQDGGTAITFAYATTIGGALTTLDAKSFTDNKAYMFLFDEVTAAEVAITFNAATVGLELGLIYAGKALIMEQPIYGGHSPQALSAVTEYESTLSDTGQFLGRSITIKGTQTSYDWRHLTPEFVYGDFAEFIESAKRLPFFIQWRPDLFEDVALCQTTSDISPANMGGGHKLMTVSVPVRGFDE